MVSATGSPYLIERLLLDGLLNLPQSGRSWRSTFRQWRGTSPAISALAPTFGAASPTTVKVRDSKASSAGSSAGSSFGTGVRVVAGDGVGEDGAGVADTAAIGPVSIERTDFGWVSSPTPEPPAALST